MSVRLKRLVLLFVVLFLVSCKKHEKLEIWERIRAEVKANNFEYLLEISADTLECVECNNGKSSIIKEDFYKNYFYQMKLIEKNNYTFFTDTISNDGYFKRHRINYSLDGKSNVIYTVLEGNNGILFLGVFGVP